MNDTITTSEPPFLQDRSGSRYSVTDRRWRGEDGTPLMLSELPGITREQIDMAEHSLWRYHEVIPVDPSHRVSLGEGFTPMLPLGWGGRRIHFKLEWFNPTSSFKDRGVAVMISQLRGQGVTHVLEDSSGNGGCSVAAYAAAAGIKAKIIVPSETPSTKVLQARAYGAEIELVGGTRDQVAEEAIRQAEQTVYASHNWNPFFLQGTKTIAYEMWESLGFTAPDNVVLVAGAGSNILGCDIAFGELLAAGQIDRRPRLLVGQPEHWASIADTFNGTDPESRGPRLPTIAEGASIANPVRLTEAVDAIRRSDGAATVVTEEQIRAAVRKLALRGVYAEPTSSVAGAALDQFLADGTIRPDETTVVILTGTGLKSAETMATVFGTGGSYGEKIGNEQRGSR